MLPLIPIAIGLGAVAAAAAVTRLRGRGDGDALPAARARARAAHQRLGLGVDSMVPDGPAAEDLRRARERWLTAGALIADATTVEACEVAGAAAAEGLRHLEAARRRSGAQP